jgi:hypothetical protein
VKDNFKTCLKALGPCEIPTLFLGDICGLVVFLRQFVVPLKILRISSFYSQLDGVAAPSLCFGQQIFMQARVTGSSGLKDGEMKFLFESDSCLQIHLLRVRGSRFGEPCFWGVLRNTCC